MQTPEWKNSHRNFKKYKKRQIVKSNASVAKTASSKAANYIKTGRLALVVDNNQKDNLTICMMLKDAGFATASAFDFTEALVLLQRLPLDLVVLDSRFEDARDIIQAVSSNTRIARIPILFIRNKLRGNSSGKSEAAFQTLSEN